MSLGLDEVYTLTTLTRGQKGQYATPPPSKPFPLPYTDNFESELWFSFVLKKPLYVVNLLCFLELLKYFSFIEQFGVFFQWMPLLILILWKVVYTWKKKATFRQDM